MSCWGASPQCHAGVYVDDGSRQSIGPTTLSFALVSSSLRYSSVTESSGMFQIRYIFDCRFTHDCMSVIRVG